MALLTNRTRKAMGLFVPAALLALLSASLPLLGGAQARIMGKVTDGKGVALEGVKITVTTPKITNFKTELVTDKDGKWGTILNDATIPYSYKFEKQGFITTAQDRKTSIGSTDEWNITLLTQDQAIEKGVIKQVVDPYTEAYNGAVEKFQAGDYEAALAGAHKAIELGPDKPNAYSMGATVAVKKQDWDHVIEWGEKALSLDPENPQVIGFLVTAYKAKGNAAKTAEYEKKYMAANPDQPEVVYNQAVEAYNKGDAKAAIPLLEKVVEGKPDFANAHFLLGMSYMNVNNVPKMKTHLKKYLELEPKGKEAGAAKEMLDAFK